MSPASTRSEPSDHGFRGKWVPITQLTALGVVLTMFWYGGQTIVNTMHSAITELQTTRDADIQWMREELRENRNTIHKAITQQNEFIQSNTRALDRLAAELRTSPEIP